MENIDRELILKMKDVDVRLKRLYDEHEKLEKELGLFGRRAFLTSNEQQKEKELKFKKLRGVEEMLLIVREYKSAA